MAFLYLDIIEDSNEKLAVQSVKHLLQNEFIYQNGSPTARRSFFLLKDKLNQISDEMNFPQIELIAQIKQFKETFEYHEM